MSEDPMEDQEGTGTATIPEEISELLERRSTYRAWLTRLDGEVGGVRRTVYERVREDYLERLGEVEDELKGHREGLEASLSERRERMADLEGQREERAARMEEAELRHRVGEYSDEDWETHRAEHEGALEELEGRLEEEATAVDRLEEVLGELDAPAPGAGEFGARAAEATETEEVVEDEATVEEEAAEVSGLETRPGWLSGTMPEPALGGGAAASALSDAAASGPEEVGEEEAEEDDDVLSFLKERPEAPPEPDAVPAADGEAAGDEDSGESGYEDELDFLESLSLDDADSLDTLSLVLDEGEDEDEDDGTVEREGGDGAA
ncbi:MAG: hypothetical protein Q8W47_06820 [Candidatus Palauibacterales bacterium]|nr:hypothetical protein [Candidatus Palauibacterales bacterium]